MLVVHFSSFPGPAGAVGVGGMSVAVGGGVNVGCGVDVGSGVDVGGACKTPHPTILTSRIKVGKNTVKRFFISHLHNVWQAGLWFALNVA